MECNIIKVPAKVGCMSLIGTPSTRPVSWGNYFNLWNDKNHRVANMWAENLEALVADGTLDDGLVEIKEYKDSRGWHYALVVDARVPDNYLYNKLCFTGAYPPSLDILRDMYSIVGDPDNEIEKYENPEKYYTDRGATYKNGIVSYRVESKPRKLAAKFTIEQSETIYCIGKEAFQNEPE